MRPRLAFLPALALMLLAVGCGGGGSSTDTSHQPVYRLVNASPDTPSLDIYVNAKKRGNAIPYLGSTPDFQKEKPDLYDFSFRPTGATEDAWSEAVQLQNDQAKIVFGFGLSNFGDEYFKRLRMGVVDVDRNAPNGSKAHLYVANAFNRQPGFDNVGVDFRNPGDNPQYKVESIGPGTAKDIVIDSGTQTFELKLTGVEQVNATKTLTFEAGKIYLVLLAGNENGTGTQAPDIRLIEIQPKNP